MRAALGEDGGEKKGRSYGDPLEYLWKSYGDPMEHQAVYRGATPEQYAYMTHAAHGQGRYAETSAFGHLAKAWSSGAISSAPGVALFQDKLS
jgi:hypothetical protein